MTVDIRIPVKWNVIQWAISNGEKNRNDLLKKYKLNKWENPRNDKDYPTFKQLQNFSRDTKIPFNYFFKDTVPSEDYSFVKFRTINNDKVKPSRRLIDTIHDMEYKQSWMKDYRVSQDDVIKLELLHKLDSDMEVEDATAIVSRIINLTFNKELYSFSDDDYFNFLKDKMSHLGIMVMQSGIVGTNTHRSLNVDEFRAFVLIDELVPLIFINSVDSKKAKIFSLIHEFVHILLGQNEILNVSPNIDIANERWINSVTINVLMPEENIKEMIKNNHNKEANIKNISNRFHVSLLATAIRMKEIKIYGDREIEWARTLQNDGLKAKKKSTGGNYYNVAVSRLDKRFATAVINEESRGNTPMDTAANMLGITLKTYKTTVNKILGLE